MTESHAEYQFIELNRTFHELSKYANEDDELDLSHAFRVGDRLSWQDLVERYRVIILSEAGSEKNAEIRNIALDLRAKAFGGAKQSSSLGQVHSRSCQTV
jgi:hypothetical protein